MYVGLHSCCSWGEQVGHINRKSGDKEHNSGHVPATESVEKESIGSPLVMENSPGRSQVNVQSCEGKISWLYGITEEENGTFLIIFLHFPL